MYCICFHLKFVVVNRCVAGRSLRICFARRAIVPHFGAKPDPIAFVMYACVLKPIIMWFKFVAFCCATTASFQQEPQHDICSTKKLCDTLAQS